MADLQPARLKRGGLLHSSRPLLRRVFRHGQLTWVENPQTPAFRPLLWHNPGWTRVYVGTRRRHIGFASETMYRRVVKRVTGNVRARKEVENG